GTVPPVIHRVDDAAVHRLETVAHVGQRAGDDHAHRVLDVAALHLGVEVDGLDAVGDGGVGHDVPSGMSSGGEPGDAGGGPPGWSDVQEAHVLGVALDEAAPGLHVL